MSDPLTRDPTPIGGYNTWSLGSGLYFHYPVVSPRVGTQRLVKTPEYLPLVLSTREGRRVGVPSPVYDAKTHVKVPQGRRELLEDAWGQILGQVLVLGRVKRFL